MKRKQYNILIVLILVIIIIAVTIIAIIKLNKKDIDSNNNNNEIIVDKEEKIEEIEFNARDEGFIDWNEIKAIKEIPEYTGKGNLKQQSVEENTAVVIYTGVSYEDAEEYYYNILKAEFIDEGEEFPLVYGTAIATITTNNSDYKYRITYNEITRELIIRGTNE